MQRAAMLASPRANATVLAASTAYYGWLERAQTRLGSYGPDGAARQRDREEFEGDFAHLALHACMPCRLTRDIALLVVHTMQTDDDDVEVQDGSAQCCLLTCPPSYSDTRTSPERQRAAVPRVFHCPRPASRLGLRGFGV